MSGQLYDQIRDRFAVFLHLGAALLNGALNVVAAAGSGPRPDEDRQVLVGDTDTSCPAALTAKCAAVPSAVD